MFPELKKDLENSIATAGASYIDAAARRSSGKVFFRNRELHDFSCFDVLGLAHSRRVRRSAQEAIESIGIGNSGSRKSAGTSSAHIICERNLAAFFGYDRALLFSSKNQVVFSLLATILREQDQVYCDSDYAGLLADVCLLLNCNIEVVDLSNLVELENIFSVQTPGRRRIVFADSISYSSGRKLDLMALSLLCLRHQILLINDESCAAGILGPRGAGVADEAEFGLSPARPFCVISDLGYGLGCYGACLCGNQILIEALAARSKTLSSEPSFPAHLAAAITTAIDVCELSFVKRALVKGKVEYISGSFKQIEQRVKTLASSFVSISFPKWKMAYAFSEYLFSKGFYCELTASPSRLSEIAYVHIFPSSWHTDDTISELLAVSDNFFFKNK